MSKSGEQIRTDAASVATAISEVAGRTGKVSSHTEEVLGVVESAVRVVGDAQATITDLDRNSDEIGQIVRAVSDIADQTRLLSYNTAIEAERAGSGARGFQVIAGRIRQLAQLTSSATADIDRHLENVRERTRSAVGAITGVAEIIHQVRAVSEEITEALSHQVQTTEDVTRRVEVVAKESARVGHVVADLAAASRKAADRAVGTRETAAQLDAESDQLRSLIEKFRVQ